MFSSYKLLSASGFSLVVSILLQSFSALTIKYASMASGSMSIFLLSFAFVFIVIRAVVWQYVLSRFPLSFVYPFTSLVQVLILIYAVFLFDETVSFFQMIGFVMMLIGLTVIAKG
jgi:multidrug transporter EmrE-like cation transporter